MQEHNHPRFFAICDKGFQYKDELVLRTFTLTSSNSAWVRRSEDVSVAFELLDRVWTKRGWWQEMLGAEASERCLSADAEAALLGGALAVEARLRSQVSRRHQILQMSEDAAQSGQQSKSGSRSARSSQPMILPTFTKPDIRFNPYIP